jgi:hypothetical protein
MACSRRPVTIVHCVQPYDHGGRESAFPCPNVCEPGYEASPWRGLGALLIFFVDLSSKWGMRKRRRHETKAVIRGKPNETETGQVKPWEEPHPRAATGRRDYASTALSP